MWLAPWFLVGGLLASVGVVIIHLMHRRRYRVVHWAAMDFLLQASRRSRRMIELRDWLLLLLRVACVSLFTVGMARPHWGNRPITSASAMHLVVMIDNSLSMGYKTLGRSLLDDAKQKAKELIRSLSPESRVTIIPFPDPAELRDLGVLCTKDEAQSLIDSLKIVDQKGDMAAALQQAVQACARFPQPKQKRLVIISDMQRNNVPSEGLSQILAKLPGPIEIIRIRSGSAANTWVEDVSLPDRFLIPGAETRFRALIRHEGTNARLAIPVVLSVKGQKVAVQTVDLLPGQTLEVAFPPYRPEGAFQKEELDWLDAEVSLASDDLPEDDHFALVIPVFNAVPIVFVDQFGPKEEPREGRYGESYYLRRLLASVAENTSPLTLRTYTLNQINRTILAGSRVVVLAGIRSPTEKLSLLSEYVRLGGNLVIIAGGEFDPAAWNQAAEDPWHLLPGKLEAVLAGRPASLVSDPSSLFYIDPESLVGEWFHIEGMSKRELAELYQSVYFFQIAQLELPALPAARPVSFNPDVTTSHAKDSLPQPVSDPSVTETPNWLLWRQSLSREEIRRPLLRSDSSSTADHASQSGPKAQVLARFTTGHPFVVVHSVGRGQVVFVSGGLSREWSSLSASYAIVMFDRLLQNLIERSIPRRNLETVENYRVIVNDPNTAWRLVAPDGTVTPISVGAVGPQQFGIQLNGFSQRGLHRLAPGRLLASDTQLASGPADAQMQPANSSELASREGNLSAEKEILLGIRGPREESVPDYVSESELEGILGGHGVLSSDNGFLQAANSHEWWPWFVAAALLGLLAELGILSNLRSRNEVSS